MTRAPSTRLTWWSLFTLALAVPTWWSVLSGSVMSRAVDGGIFLSVAGGLNAGLPLYTGVWDNKDPLFYAVFAVADRVHPIGSFLTDWFWLPLAAIGAWLLARSVMSHDRSLFIALVVAPWLVAGPLYVPGWSSTPGTALVLLALGLLARRRMVGAGIAVGLLAFVKLTVWPIALVALLWLLVPSSTRRGAIRGVVALAGTLAATLVALGLLGWLGGYVEMIQRNRAYADDVIAYFGYTGGVAGHLAKAQADWAEATWIGAGATAAVLVLSAFTLLVPSMRNSARTSLVVWLGLSVAGTFAIVATTYVWPHHAQALALPAVLAAIVGAAIVPERWPFPVWAAVTLVVAFAVSGWTSPGQLVDRFRATTSGFSAALDQAGQVPVDARLLNTSDGGAFTFVRLGSNDDGGFLRDLRPGISMACPAFHLYDFSPGSAFEEAWACLDHADVVLLTDNFVVFGNGGKAASVQPVLGKVGALFDCKRVEDRQICSRRAGV